MQKLIARLRARFVLWLLPDIEGHLIVRSMNFNSQALDPARKRREPVEFIYPRIHAEDSGEPLTGRRAHDTASGLAAPRVPFQHIQ